MNVIYEEDSVIKAGTIVLDQLNTLQLDSTHGKRVKIKSTSVLLRFEHNALIEFLDEASKQSKDIDVELLWEFSSQDEFNFQSLAHEYFGHVPTPLEAVSVLLKLQDSPIYFYKKGKGRFKSATSEAVQSTIAGLERKKQESDLIQHYTNTFKAFQLPDTLSEADIDMLIYHPNKNNLFYKAFHAVYTDLGITRQQLLQKCGLIKDIYQYHYNRFYLEYFPKTKNYEDLTEQDKTDSIDADFNDLDKSIVKAFSIDDANTTEIDDAFSLQIISDEEYKIGIHIAIPALGIVDNAPLDILAKQRLSTVYIPGKKITMLPDWAVDVFTLKEGSYSPAISLYVTINPRKNYEILDYETCIEQVFIETNLRHDPLDQHFNDETVKANLSEIPTTSSYQYERELNILYQFANTLASKRGKVDPKVEHRFEYNFVIDKEKDRVDIIARLRGDPIDRVVEEMMVLANSYWAEQLHHAGFLGLFRVQESGKVKMSTLAGRHQGMGVEYYMWSTSPIRRYVDLINQRQLISWVYEDDPFYSRQENNLFFEIIRGFETIFVAYSNFQRSMEKYWCLRWLLQENITTIEAQVVKENYVRLTHLPLSIPLAYLPDLPVGEIINLKIDHIDLLDLVIECHYE